VFRDARNDGGLGQSAMICGVVALRLRDFDAARAFQEEALAAYDRLGNEPWAQCAISTVLGNLGNVAVGRGDIDEAEVRFLVALERQRAIGYAPGTSHPYASHPLAGLGDVARARGDIAVALHWYREGLACAWRFGDVRAAAYALGGVAGTLAAAGCWAAAARLFGAAEAYHEASGLPFDLETMDRQRALGLPEPWQRAGEPFGSGEALRAALRGRVTVALPTIPESDLASRLWAEGRALPVAEAIAEALNVAPVEQAPLTQAPAPYGLSPREAEVLRLVAAGRSNAEIAAALGISPRTATTHASHILDKLGLASRAEAIAFAHRVGLA
jgi:DNA-binding CsgD family transcriptional regulator